MIIMAVTTVDLKVGEWNLPIPKDSTSTNEEKMTALIEGAKITVNYTDGETKTIRFKKGSVIKSTVTHGSVIQSWNPNDELLDTTTR